MTKVVESDRRSLLKTGGTLLAVGLAGCAGNNDNSSTIVSPTSNTTGTTTQNNTGSTDGNNETTEPDIPESYRADRKRIADSSANPEDIGDYSTEQNWDNLVTNTEEIRQAQQNWTLQQAYTPVVTQVMRGEDLSPGNKIFPNYSLEGEENDRGYFDQDTVKSEDDFETIVRWYLPLITHHDRENHGHAPSGRNDRFATTLEKLINDHHPEAEAKSTSVKALPTHGIFGVQDTKGEAFYLVDTTPASAQGDSAVGRIGNFATSGFDPSRDIDRQNLWDPFHEFQPGSQENLHYEGKSKTSMAALTNFVTKSITRYDTEHDDSKYFITDEWMDDAYHRLRNGGSIDPIVEPIEDMIQNHIENEEGYTIGIYGTLDDTRIAIDSGDKIYEQVVYRPEPQSIDDIESMLEAS